MPEQLGKNEAQGTIARGLHQQVIAEGVATRTLIAAESGSLCVFDTAAGVLYTLPTPVVGMYFDFMPSITTTGEYKVITKTIASEFMLGAVFSYTTTVTLSDAFEANGSTHVSINHDGGATGGDQGGIYRLTAISTTQWLITGTLYCGTTTPTTPFDTT